MAASPASPHGSATRRAGAREWAALAVLALPTLLIGLDLTVLHLAVPEIAADLRPSATGQLWIVDSYGFAVAGLLLTMGNLGDRIGRRRLLLIGGAAFALASVGAAFAPSPGALIVARVLLGIAGATLMPSTLSLIRDLFTHDDQRTFAVSVWLAALLGGTALGPLAGGVLLEFFWWGSVFLLAVPVMLALLVLGPWLLPRGSVPEKSGPIDVVSVALSLLAALPAVYAIKESAEHGVSPLLPVLLVVSVVAAVGFVRRQRRLDEPLLDLSLFADRRFRVAITVHLFALFALVGMQYLLAQYLQLVAGLPPLHAGLWTLPLAVGGVAGALLAPRLARRFGSGRTIAFGLALAAVAMALITQSGISPGLAWFTGLFGLAALAVNLCTGLTTDRIVSAAPVARAGMAAAVSETAAEFGIALGIALLGSLTAAVQRAHTDAPLAAGDVASGAAFTSGMEVSAGVAAVLLGALAVLAATRLRD